MDSIAYLKNKVKTFKEGISFNAKDTNYINTLNRLGWELRYYNRDSLLMLSNEALDLSVAIDYDKGILESKSNIAEYYLFNGNPDTTISNCSDLIASANIDKFFRLKSRIYNQMGQAYFVQGHYPDAYFSFLNSLEVAEKHNSQKEIIKMNMNLGTLFSLLEDYEEALKFYADAKKGLLILDDEITTGRVLSNLGFLHMKKKEMTKSLAFLDDSIEIFTKLEVPEWLAFALISKAELYLGNEEYAQALNFFMKAFTIHESLEDLKGMADVNYGIGVSNLGLENMELAETHILKSLKLFESFKLKTGLEKCYRALYKLNKKRNSIDKSLFYLEQAKVYADSISKDKKQRDISMLKAKLEFEQDKLAMITENEKQVAQQKTYVQWATVCLIAAILIAIVMKKSNHREKQLNKALEEKTVVLSDNQKKLNKINKNQDKLFSIVGHDLRGPIVSLKELIGLALESPQGESYFKKFAPKLKNDVEHIQFTLDNLLNWGQTQMEGVKLSPETIVVKNEIESIRKLFRKNISKKSILFKNNLTDNMKIFMDLDHFSVVFRNLICNAIKFTPENGSISINATKNLNKLIITVKDNGVGMSDEVLSKIFDDTEHYSTYGTNQEKGTGLGLSLCMEMVEKNKGSIQVESSLEQGSVFSVSFPIEEII